MRRKRLGQTLARTPAHRALRVWVLVRGLSALLCGLAVALPSAFAQTNRPEDSVPRIYHKGRNFKIPFNLNSEGRDRVKEVHLLVSEDEGYHWTAKSKTYPDRPTFTFRSPRDGEYWFAVQTITTDGRVSPRPDETVEPNLKVVVDTIPPTILVEPEGRRGSIAAVRWEVKDENLDLKSFVLEYQVDGASTWRRVPIRTLRPMGKISWDAGTAEALKVRGLVKDKAGNLAQTVIDLGEGTASSPVAGRDGLEFAAAPEMDLLPGEGMPRISAGEDFSPVDVSLGGPASEAHVRAGRAQGRERIARTSSTAEDRSKGVMRRPPPGSATDVDLFAPAAPAAPAVGVPAVQAWDAPSSGKARTQQPASTSTRPADGPRETLLVGSPRFSLQYAVDDAGPEGPASVELWITRDGGRTWIRRGEDADHVSPITIDLGGEGTYGISLVARSASGVGDQPPAPGDPPQTWVEVDSSPPVVMMRPPQVGSGPNAGKIALAWSASDLHLTPRSTSIFWKADQPGADWQLVAAGLENEGRYVWNVPPSVPDRFHVRIEATDTVGHRGGADTTDSGPIQIDRSRPRSRIIGLDPSSRVVGEPDRATR